MSFPPEHEIHHRRFSRNLGVGVALAGFVALVFALTLVKVANGDLMHANDAAGGIANTVPMPAPDAPAATAP